MMCAGHNAALSRGKAEAVGSVSRLVKVTAPDVGQSGFIVGPRCGPANRSFRPPQVDALPRLKREGAFAVAA